MVKIIHAADLHLDSAFSALDTDAARFRRAHQRSLVQKIVEIGNEEQVDLILLPGDLFDGKNSLYETAQALGTSFAKSRAKIFIAPGNHDPYNNESPYRAAHFSDNVHLFTRESIEKVELPELNCVVYGAAFTSMSCEKPLLEGFSAEEGALNLMVLHGEVTSSPSKNNPISREQIEKSNLNYLALGHVHSYKGVMREGKTSYAYPGTPEGRGFDECGEKGILIGTVSESGVNLEFRKISPYAYEERVIDINDLEKSVPEDARCEVCRIILTGETNEVNTEEIENRYKERFYKLNVLDRTVAPHSVWDSLDEDSVKGMFLRKLKESGLDEETIDLAATFGISAIENREV